MLTRLIYYSENHLGAADGRMIGSLNAIMDSANRNNERDGITGALLFDTLWFVQILEGEREAVSATVRRIVADERTSGLTLMDVRAVTERLFANWWMGLAMLRADRDHQTVVLQHGLAKLDPRKISGERILALAVDLAQVGLNRRLAAPAA